MLTWRGLKERYKSVLDEEIQKAVFGGDGAGRVDKEKLMIEALICAMDTSISLPLAEVREILHTEFNYYKSYGNLSSYEDRDVWREMSALYHRFVVCRDTLGEEYLSNEAGYDLLKSFRSRVAGIDDKPWADSSDGRIVSISGLVREAICLGLYCVGRQYIRELVDDAIKSYLTKENEEPEICEEVWGDSATIASTWVPMSGEVKVFMVGDNAFERAMGKKKNKK